MTRKREKREAREIEPVIRGVGICNCGHVFDAEWPAHLDGDPIRCPRCNEYEAMGIVGDDQ